MGLGRLGDDRASGAQARFDPPMLGLAVFQNDANPSNGVAVRGRQRIKPFESRTALSSDCLWISTAAQGDVAQNFRPKNYLRSTLDALADDLGVELRDVVEGLPQMGVLLEQVFYIVHACYQWEDPRLAWSRATLAEVLRDAMPRQPDPKMGIIGPLKDALQSYSSVPDRVTVRSAPHPVRQYTLRHNRLEYAQYLLSQPVPDPLSEWFFSDLREVDQLLDSQRPCLIEVALEFDAPRAGEPDYSRLCAFGSAVSGRRSAGAMRRWVSQPELAWLSRHAHVHVQQVLMSAAEAVAVPNCYRLPQPLTSDPLLSMSLAAGVVAEAHWVSLTLGRLKKREHSGASSRFEEVFSPLSVWLKACDRAYGFFMAAQAAEAGYEVVGYGYGAVTIEADRNEPGKLLELADKLGVCHPNLIALQNRIALGGMEVELQD